jgi:phosphatidate cytidylyltransferase
MPAAVTTGLILVAAFLGAIMWRPAAVMLIVLAVVGLAAVEFFSKVTEKGYRPATFAGLITCIAAPLAAYWMGDGALPLVFAFGFLATSIGFLGATSIQSGPMPNVAITTMAMTWIGLLGSFAALILRYSVNGAGAHVGTDTLFMVVVAVIANDVGGLFVGSSVGRTPLREWVSPNKTIEGAVGGALASIVALIIFGSQNGTWNSMGEWIALGLLVAVMAPLGDLVESMFKRNLDVKDFGSIVAGHGGVLDRFDGFFFVLPAAYYLMLVLQPWL